MHRVKWLLPLLILFCSPARAVNPPLQIDGCTAVVSSHISNPASCTIPNTLAGDLVWFFGTGYFTSTVQGVSWQVTGTESFTCPTGSTKGNVFSGSGFNTIIACHVILASSHDPFTCTFTSLLTPFNPAGGAAMCLLYRGVAAFDVAGGSATTLSTNLTTTNSDEFILAGCTDGGTSTQLTPSTGFTQQNTLNTVTPTSAGQRNLAGYQVTAGAGSYTSACSAVSSQFPQIVAEAFTIGTVPATPAVYPRQQCWYLTFPAGGGPNSDGGCELFNTLNTTKITGAYSTSNSAAIPTGINCTETCNVPSAASNLHTYTIGWATGIAWVDPASTHSIFAFTMHVGAAPDGVRTIHAYEMVGLASGSDASSGAGAAATSVGFTAGTAGTAFCVANDSVTANPMAATNSFVPFLGSSNMTAQGGVVQMMTSFKNIAAGADTCGYTLTGSTAPQSAVLNFAPSTTFSPRFSSIL